MVVQHNLPAMNSHRQLGINTSSTAKNLEKLSSGLQVNRAGDDAAGLAISEKMRGQIRGLDMAKTNAENGVSMIQTAEGGLNETHAVLQRMRELSVQSANGTYANEVDRENINKEVSALKDEIDRIASSTHYNGIKLIDGTLGGTKTTATTAGVTIDAEIVGKININTGSALVNAKDVTISTKVIDGATFTSVQVGDKTYTTDGTAAGVTLYASDGTLVGTIVKGTKGGVVSGVDLGAGGSAVDIVTKAGTMTGKTTDKLTFQIGANGSADQQVKLSVGNMATGSIGSKNGNVAAIKVDTRDNANAAISIIDSAVNQVSSTRADLGALQNRLEHTIDNLGTTSENLQVAESSIRDVDMAKEMMEFTKNNILSQASQAMLAQSNMQPQGVLSLLR